MLGIYIYIHTYPKKQSIAHTFKTKSTSRFKFYSNKTEMQVGAVQKCILL